MNRFELFYDLYKHLYNLDYNWDDDGGSNLMSKLIDESFNFIERVFRLIPNLDDPDISPCPDGSLDIYWNTKELICLINLCLDEKDNILVNYHLAYKMTEFKSKGKFHPISQLDLILNDLDHVSKLRLDKISQIINS